jgi:PAS domain S-box-containing protein
LARGLDTVSNRKTSAPRRTTPKTRHDPATDRLLRLAVEAGDVLPWEWNIPSDTFRWGAPPTWLLGPLPKGATVYPDLRQVVHPEDLERFLAAGREAKAHAGTYQIEFRVVRGDGTARHILARGHSHAESGTRPTSIIGVIVDIEARKRAQDAAETLTAAQRALLDSLPDVTWLKSTQGHLTAVNRAFGERYGMAPETAVGKTDFDIYPDDKALRLRSEDAQIMSSRLPVRYESTQNVDGRDYWVEVVKAPIFDATGNVIGTVGTSRDISARRSAERDLRDSEQRFRMLAELSSDWFWEQDSEFRFVNFVAKPAVELDFSRLIGKRRWEVPTEGMTEDQWNVHRATLKAHLPFYNLQYVSVQADGSRRWFSNSGKPYYDGNGRFTGYRGVGRDVTDRVNAEAELRLAKERLEMALEGSRLVLWDIDLTTGEVYLSEEWARLVGFPPGETRITSEDLMAMVHPADVPEVRRLSREASRGERDEYMLEHRVRAADASWKWILSHGRVSARDAAGKPVRMSGTNLDINGRKSMETSLHQALRQSETLLETTPTAIAVMIDRVILRCNPAMERLFGTKPGELLGQSTRVLFPSEADWEATGKKVYESIARGETFSGELELVRQNGEHFWVVAAGRSIEPGSPEVLFAYNDVTTQQNLAQALAAAKAAADAANRAKSGFLAAMSHEIRTPMNGVLGMLELLELTELDAEQRETLTLARDSAVSLLRLIDEILDFSKIEAGQLAITPEPVSLAELANRAAAVYRELASRKGVLLECKVDPRIAEAHMADGLRVSQIVNNLLSNAIKFTAQGEVTLEIESVERGAGDELVRIRVTDTGIGVPPEHQGRLFQPFVQADSDTTRVYGGTGLGLSICRRLAELMGGSIGLQSQPGLGTTVTALLRFPLTDPSVLRSRKQARIDQLAAIGGRGRGANAAAGACILIADDHPINLMLIQRQTALLGYTTDLARDGVEALEKWKTGAYALVLTDCDMPRMDGYQLAREIRHLEAANKTPRPIPIIACTANAWASDATVCIDAGMNDYLSKPFTLPALQSKLGQWIGSDVVATDASAAAGGPPGPTAAAKPGLAGAGPASGQPPLDAVTLDQFTGGDEDLRREMLREFLAANAADAVALREALAGEDVAAIARAAHRAKGASRMIGAQRFADVAERIENAARTGDRAAVRGCVTDFEREQARLVECLRAETGERQGRSNHQP